jgi:H+-transporting ATPase
MEMAAIVAIVLSNGPTPWLCNPNWVYNNATQTYNNSYAACASTNQEPDWEDFVGIICLLLLNSIIGYFEEEAAGEAVSKLMGKLTRSYNVKREGKWEKVLARDLVEGDILVIKLGDVIPADCKLLHGEPMKIDQSSLTGESLPVTREPGDEVYSGSTVKTGEIEALVVATGERTFLGKAASAMNSVEGQSHLQEVLRNIGGFCMAYIGIWILVICAVVYGKYEWAYRRGINMILVVLIGGIPIAMPTVLSVTMAIGVNQLAKRDAIVTRITAVEELAGMDILCSDKTGTLTKNHLTLKDPSLAEGCTDQEIMTTALLCSRLEGDPDAIDQCIKEYFEEKFFDCDALKQRYEILKFIPFDPVSKRVIAHVLDKNTQKKFACAKGAPQVIINLAHNANEIRDAQNAIVKEFADAGFRALGVAKADDAEFSKWNFMGLLSMSDPPRRDTARTIKRAKENGVRVIMITGDQVAIGRQTAKELGMGLNFHSAHILREKYVEGVPITEIVEQSNGWGEVMPEDKFFVVQTLRENGHLVGMTGDGVNDAPALKRADVGVAVHGATDAARGAADIVLLTEGLSVIITALIGSRCIFQRMRSYSLYACTTTIRVVTTFGILAVAWQFSFPPFCVLMLAILNDGTIMSISTDNVLPSEKPDKWRLRDIFITSFVMGFYYTASTLVFYYIVNNTTFFENVVGPNGQLTPIKYNMTYPGDPQSWQMNSIIYLQVSITGQAVIFSTRARGFFFQFWQSRKPLTKEEIEEEKNFAKLKAEQQEEVQRAINHRQSFIGGSAVMAAMAAASATTTGGGSAQQTNNTGGGNAAAANSSSSSNPTLAAQGSRYLRAQELEEKAKREQAAMEALDEVKTAGTPSLFLICAFGLAQLIASLIAAYAYWGFTQMYPVGTQWIGVCWVYSLIWISVQDIPKIITRWILEGETFGSLHQKALFKMNLMGGGAHLGNVRSPNRDTFSKAYGSYAR